MSKSLPYFNIQQDGHWTFQCPHEPYRSVYVTIINAGEIVCCRQCMQKLQKELNRKTVSDGEKER